MANRFWLAASAAVAALAGTQAGAAAQTTAPAATEGNASETVVITATKRAENLQTVPVAVSAFGSKDRDKLGIVSVQDLTNYVPGVQYQTGLDRFYVRGVGRSSNNPGSDGDTAIYVDGVFTESSYAAATPNILLADTEVLRGPQTSLWGRNALGGALLISSKHPDLRQTEEGRVSYGAFDRWEGAGRVSGPLPGTDKVRYSVAGDYWHQGDGYFKNINGGKNEGNEGYVGVVDGQIEADFTPHLNGWLRVRSATYDYSNRVSTSNAPIPTGKNAPASLGPNPGWATVPGNALDVVTLGPLETQNPTFPTSATTLQHGDLHEFVANTWGHQNLKENYDVASQISWDFAGTNLKYIGGAQRYLYHLYSDFDGTNVVRYTVPVTTTNPDCTLPAPATQCATIDGSAVNVYVEDRKWWTHELDWSSKNDFPLQWLIGAYMYHENEDNPSSFPTTGLAHAALVAPLLPNGTLADPNPSGSIYTTDGAISSTSISEFGQLDWNITKQFKATAGIRYTHDHKKGTERFRELCYDLGLTYCPHLSTAGATATAEDITPGAGTLEADGFRHRTLEDNWDALTGTAGIQWMPNPDTMFYAKADRAAKPGAFNLGTISATPEVGPEKVHAFEIGAKARPLSGLQTNLAIFHYDWLGRQTPLTYVAGALGTVCENSPTNCTVLVNLPKSKSEGLELESTWTPLTDMHVRFDYSYLNAVVVNAGGNVIDTILPAGHQSVDVSGFALPNTPNNRYVIGGDYTFRPSIGSIFLGLNYSWRSHSYTEFTNEDLRRTPSYGVANLTAIWTDPNGRFNVEGHVNNLFDEIGYEGVFVGTAYTNATAAGVPAGKSFTSQTYGITSPRVWSVEFRAKF